MNADVVTAPGAFTAVALAALGALVAELLEGLRLYVNGAASDDAYRWPDSPPLRRYLVGSGIRLALAVAVATALVELGMVCDETVAFFSGLATLKTIDLLFGYVPTPE